MREAICYVSLMNPYHALFFVALGSFARAFRFEVDGSLVIDDLDAVAEHAQVQTCSFLRAAALMP
jgi:hypothetical protein